MSLARLLAHYESPTSPALTLVPVEFARELARSMRAEKLSARLYRLFPPDSIFTPARDFPQPHLQDGESLNLGASEIHGLRFMPDDPARQRAARRADAMAILGEYFWA